MKGFGDGGATNDCGGPLMEKDDCIEKKAESVLEMEGEVPV